MTVTTDSADAILLHVGARADDVAELAPDARAVLVVPLPVEAEAIAAQIAGRSGINLYHGVLAGQDGTGLLKIFNQPEQESLAAPTAAFRALLPGLRQVAEHEVPLIPLATLAGDPLLRDGPLRLIVEAPGAEMAVLEGLQEAGILDRVGAIRLTCGEEVFLEGATPRAGLESWLSDAGFEVDSRDLSDPDWPVLHLSIDHRAQALARAEARIAELEAALAERTAEAEAAEERASREIAAAEARAAMIEAARATFETRLAARDRALAEQIAEFKALEERAARDRVAAAAKRAQAIEESEARARAAEERNADLEHRLAAARDDLRRAEGQVTLIKDLLLAEPRL